MVLLTFCLVTSIENAAEQRGKAKDEVDCEKSGVGLAAQPHEGVKTQEHIEQSEGQAHPDAPRLPEEGILRLPDFPQELVRIEKGEKLPRILLRGVLAEQSLESVLEPVLSSLGVLTCAVGDDAAVEEEPEELQKRFERLHDRSFLWSQPDRLGVKHGDVEVHGGSKRLAHIRIFVHICVRRVEKYPFLNTKNSYININRGLSRVLAI